MRNPDAPFLELGFYFSDRDGQNALEQLLNYMVYEKAGNAKVVYTTESDCHRRPLVEYNLNKHGNRIDHASHLWKLFGNKALTITKVAMEGGTRIVPNARDYFVLLPINEASAGTDHNPIAIWMEGESLSHSVSSTPARSRTTCKKALDVFREIVLALRPSYGAITVDYALECPSDIVNDPRTLAFQDFYLARQFVGDGNLASIRKIRPDAYHEELPGGQITCCSSIFSPTEISLSAENAEALSAHVGKIIGRKAQKSRQQKSRE